jgi:hypothetical protein
MISEVESTWAPGKDEISTRGTSSSTAATLNGRVRSATPSKLQVEVPAHDRAKVQQAQKELLHISADALVKLKKNGLTKAVLEAMVKRAMQRR